MSENSQNPSRSVAKGLAFVAGVGLILMIIALGIGVIGGDQAAGDSLGLLFIVGLALLILGFAGWFSVVQPHKNFDDITVPQYTGHHGDDEH